MQFENTVELIGWMWRQIPTEGTQSLTLNGREVEIEVNTRITTLRGPKGHFTLRKCPVPRVEGTPCAFDEAFADIDILIGSLAD